MFVKKNKKFIIYLISFFLLLVACNNKTENQTEEGIISENEMVDIIVDLHLTDATINIKHFNKRTNNKKIVKYYASVLKKHGYTRLNFDESIKYYSIEPEKLDNIYDRVIQELSKKQELIKSEK